MSLLKNFWTKETKAERKARQTEEAKALEAKLKAQPQTLFPCGHGVDVKRNTAAGERGVRLARHRAKNLCAKLALAVPLGQPTNNARTRKLRGLPTKREHVHFYGGKS